MAPLAATLLFAALASAEYTTTLWMTKVANSDKYGYVASVIDADSQQMTLSMNYDDNTDRKALGVDDYNATFTFGPSSFVIDQQMTRFAPQATGDVNIRLQCTQPSEPNDDVQCTQIYGDEFARRGPCNPRMSHRPPTPNVTTTFPHTYGTGIWGPAGTETVAWTIDFPASLPTTTPAWCTNGDDVPASVKTFPYTTNAAQFAMYQVVVTAGEEKLSALSPSATQSTTAGSTGSVSGANATASATASAPAATVTGAAGRTSVVVHTIAGLGLVALIGLL